MTYRNSPLVPNNRQTVLRNTPTLLEERFRNGYSAMRDRPGNGLRFSSLAGDDLLYILYLFARGHTDWYVSIQVRVRKRHITAWRKKLEPDFSIYPGTGFVVPVDCAYPRDKVRYFCRYCGLHAGRQDVISEHAYGHVFGREIGAKRMLTLEQMEIIVWNERGRFTAGPADDDRLSPDNEQDFDDSLEDTESPLCQDHVRRS